MYAKTMVKIPDAKNGITRKKIKGVIYIYYSFGREYNPEKKYTIPKCTSIGKLAEKGSDMMYPNENYLKFFPGSDVPDILEEGKRSGCIRIGGYIIIKKIIEEYKLDELLKKVIGDRYGLFLDLAAYSIITEKNIGQYYPDYAFHHPLFTAGMEILSDSTVSSFIHGISRDQSLDFLEEWNQNRKEKEKIYVSYDSTNKNCQAGEIEIAEYGHAKTDMGVPIINYSIAYGQGNNVPLYYEDYPGSIVDVSQLEYMLKKAEGYGYQNVGFILDRGYFSKENLHYLDKYEYDFVIMMKGMKKLVCELVAEVKGSFEDDCRNDIPEYDVSGITVKRKLFETDEKERYFHIIYSDEKKNAEKKALKCKIAQMEESLKKQEGTNFRTDARGILHYFDLIYYHPGKEDEKFLYARKRYEAENEDIRYCGYFVLITSRKMSAGEAVRLYKSRDESEKLFRTDKSFLGNKSFRVHSTDSVHAKIFIEFVALIIRNRIYTYLREEKKKSRTRGNYFSVPAALRELEKIEMIQQPGGDYIRNHALTAIQKEILKAFGINLSHIRQEAVQINERLKKTVDRKDTEV